MPYCRFICLNSFIKFGLAALFISSGQGLIALELSSPLLRENLKSKNSWIVLSLVAESEKQASITPDGEKLRKELEEAIQVAGGDVLNLSLADRMRLERLWSLPYSGRFSDELKKEALDNKAGILTGSYSVQSPEKIQLLMLTAQEQKSLIFYEDSKASANKTSATQVPEPKIVVNSDDSMPSHKTERQGFKWPSLTDNLEPSRQLPDEKQRRRSTHQHAIDQRKERLKTQLNNNSVLQRYKTEIAAKSENEKVQLCGEFINNASNSILTSTKIELFSRAYVLNASLNHPDLAIESQLLEQLISHEDFFRDRDKKF